MIYYLMFLVPPMLLAMLAQFWIQRAYARSAQLPARMTGAQAARLILDRNGMHHVPVEETGGQLSDHYDPSARVVRLSTHVYRVPSLASVGIAAHEVGHAIQHNVHYAPLVIRNLAVPAANLGSNFGMLLLMIGLGFALRPVAWVGVAVFSATVFFQLINLPVEFNASSRGKQQLVDLGIVQPQDMGPIRSVLYAAALTYVAATLQSVMTMLYYVTILSGGRRSNDE
jgi:Zn-dependent membrane protease YugP